MLINLILYIECIKNKFICFNFYSFRHFFNHRFHQEIVEQMDQVYHNIDSGEKIEEDSAGAAAAYASCFYKNVSNSFMLFAKTSLNK